MLDVFWSADDIHIGAVNGRPVDVAVSCELLAQPNQKVLVGTVLLDWSGWYSPEFACHLKASAATITGLCSSAKLQVRRSHGEPKIENTRRNLCRSYTKIQPQAKHRERRPTRSSVATGPIPP